MKTMVNKTFLLCCYFHFIFICMNLYCGVAHEDRKVYIVYMGALPRKQNYSPTAHHLNLLQEVVSSSDVEKLLVRSFKRSFSGFAAKLTYDEQLKLASKEGVVSVFPSETFQLHTTRSWEFMGFNSTTKRLPNIESDTIIGFIDSGVWPESQSFDDKGFAPPPKKWKGVCKGGANFTCNNKIIGARYYIENSARDMDGHGSHTASTAAGNRVTATSLYGLAEGTVQGGVPSARIAVYKSCNLLGCPLESVLAAFDDAIADGVDVISISLGPEGSILFNNDPIAIGSYHAIGKGILTVNAAGNSGVPRTVGSTAPWILTVGASTTDRYLVTKAVLGNGKTLTGISINTFSLNGTKYPLIYGAGTPGCELENVQTCAPGCLDREKVKGKIVICEASERSGEALRAGAVGYIELVLLPNVSSTYPLPATSLNKDDHIAIRDYVNSDKNPEVEILKTEAVKDDIAPTIAFFSSHGPNYRAPDILKPDLTAPGINILAAYSPFRTIIEHDDREARHVNYNIMSGTSMSCPHAAGAAAYVKTFHPDWSPSAIKSALMTTAWAMDASRNEDAEFVYGSGHVNPVNAIDPGLVYDALEEDYIRFLCGSGFDDATISKISGQNSTCPQESKTTLPRDLNYPTMSAKATTDGPQNVTFHRTVTNVGGANSTYKVKVTQKDLKVVVEPEVLFFESLNEKKSFVVRVSGVVPNSSTSVLSSPKATASLEWSDGIHNVRSPIVLYRIQDIM